MNDKETSRRLLVVDDDSELADALVKSLERAGHVATAAHNVDDAIAALSNAAPDLVILDVRMPGLSGLRFSEMLKQQFAIPFIFLSGANDDETVRQATAMGALAYLVKPMDLRQCIPSINAALARAAELSALRKSESQLATALQQSRSISVAVGLLMERLRVDRDTAFDTLRDEARSQRRRINEVADELLLAAEKLNRLGTSPARRKGRPV
jgi:AmiR/NasT family two-component response regulator